MSSVDYSNCHVKIDGHGFLTATVDLNKPLGLSSTKKSISFGTSNGNKKIVWNDKIISFGLNCYTKNPKYVPTKEDKT